jgi:protein subunit release factor A
MNSSDTTIRWKEDFVKGYTCILTHTPSGISQESSDRRSKRVAMEQAQRLLDMRVDEWKRRRVS